MGASASTLASRPLAAAALAASDTAAAISFAAASSGGSSWSSPRPRREQVLLIHGPLQDIAPQGRGDDLLRGGRSSIELRVLPGWCSRSGVRLHNHDSAMAHQLEHREAPNVDLVHDSGQVEGVRE